MVCRGPVPMEREVRVSNLYGEEGRFKQNPAKAKENLRPSQFLECLYVNEDWEEMEVVKTLPSFSGSKMEDNLMFSTRGIRGSCAASNLQSTNSSHLTRLKQAKQKMVNQCVLVVWV